MSRVKEAIILVIAILISGFAVDGFAQQQVYTTTTTGPKVGDKGNCQPRLEVLEVCKSLTSNVYGGFRVEPVGGTMRTLRLGPGESEVVDVTGGAGRMVKITEVSPGLVQVMVKKVELVNGQLVYTTFPFVNGTSLLSGANVGHSVDFVNQVVSGKDGRDGKDGKDGAPGRDGTPGRDGRDGKDGKDACGTRIIPDFDFAPVGVSIPVSATANWNCTPFVLFYLPSVILPDEYRSDGKKGDGKAHTAAVLIDPTTGLGQIDYPFHPHADMMPEMPFDKVEWLPGTTSFNWWAHGQGWGVKWNTSLKPRQIPGFVVFPQ